MNRVFKSAPPTSSDADNNASIVSNPPRNPIVQYSSQERQSSFQKESASTQLCRQNKRDSVHIKNV